MRALTLLAPVLAAAAILGACGKSTPPESPADSGKPVDCTLVMGWDPWEPYHYSDPTGEIRGFDVQLVRAIGREAGCNISFHRDSWSALLDKVARGEIHFISGATKTPEREKIAYFSSPYRSEDFVLYVRAGTAEDWPGDSLHSLLTSGMVVGVTDAYLYGEKITALQNDSEFADSFVRSAVGDESAQHLLDGEVDGFIEDEFVGTAAIRRRGLEAQIQVHPLGLQSGGEVRFMFSRAAVPADLVARFDAALQQVKASGEYAEIEGRYLR